MARTHMCTWWYQGERAAQTRLPLLASCAHLQDCDAIIVCAGMEGCGALLPPAVLVSYCTGVQWEPLLSAALLLHLAGLCLAWWRGWST
jgi:hypothetical protein